MKTYNGLQKKLNVVLEKTLSNGETLIIVNGYASPNVHVEYRNNGALNSKNETKHGKFISWKRFDSRLQAENYFNSQH